MPEIHPVDPRTRLHELAGCSPPVARSSASLQSSIIRNHLNTAAHLCGISERVVYAWRRKAEEPDARPRVVQLVQSLQEAEAIAEASALQTIVRAGHNGEWRASLSFLARRFPEAVGRPADAGADHPSNDQPVDARAQLARAIEALGEELMDDPFIDVNTSERVVHSGQPCPPIRPRFHCGVWLAKARTSASSDRACSTPPGGMPRRSGVR